MRLLTGFSLGFAAGFIATILMATGCATQVAGDHWTSWSGWVKESGKSWYDAGVETPSSC